MQLPRAEGIRSNCPEDRAFFSAVNRVQIQTVNAFVSFLLVPSAVLFLFRQHLSSLRYFRFVPCSVENGLALSALKEVQCCLDMMTYIPNYCCGNRQD